MTSNEIPVPNLTTALTAPLNHMEKTILNQVPAIESWFRQQWSETPPPLTSSVDLRHAGFKLAPVDTNLFPAGFNNLNPAFLPLCIQAAQSVIFDTLPNCVNIVIIPENHTRNQFYFESLALLRTIFLKAGFNVRIGSFDSELEKPKELILKNGETLEIERIKREGDNIVLKDFNPCLLLLNNDLSHGIPSILENVNQPIRPPAQLGWSGRLKSNHFDCFDAVARDFSNLIGIDSWLINPFFSAIEGMDFIAQEGIETLAKEVDAILSRIATKYQALGITNEPFVVVKADNGTYGMNVMMVRNAEEIRQMNRKQRTKMSSSKGGYKVEKVLIQEGVYTFETMPNGAVAEPVLYMIGQFVVGGFYRVHQGRGIDENLNAPGMHFEHLAFAKSCNMPSNELTLVDCPNRFYVYGVIARLAALAAAREIAAIGERV